MVKNLTENVLGFSREELVGCVRVCVSGDRLIDFMDLILWQTTDTGKESADRISNSYGEVRLVFCFFLIEAFN